jgi:hypothetical protein
MQYLRHAKCPDETIFHTALMSDSGLKVDNTDKRFIVWREGANNPEILGLEHLDAIVASDAWFARKVDEPVCPELLDRLDEIASNHSRLPETQRSR